jgi:heme exporter protein A
MKLFAHDLRCERGGRQIFDSVNFSASSGKAIEVTGPNGAGKSSLLRIVAGLLPVAGGALGLEDGATDLTLSEQAHYLGHRDAFKPALTVAENLAFWRDFLGGGMTDQAAEISASLHAVGIGHAENLPAAYLSAGQRRRLSLARLIAVKRPIWLLDEPVSALDQAGQTMAAGLMADHLTGGGIIVAATHGPLGIDAQSLRIGGA